MAFWRNIEITPRLVLVTTCAWIAVASTITTAQRDLAALTNTIWDLAWAGRSAGVVVRLPTAPAADTSAFMALLDMGKQAPKPLDLHQTTRAVLQARFGGGELEDVGEGTVLADQSAASCNRLLGSTVLLASEEMMFPAIVAAINQVTSQSIPDGAFGTCMPQALLRPGPRVRLMPGSTLKQVLATAVMSEPGSIWIAVEAPDESCTFGLVLKAEAGGACRIQLGQPVR
jgi:hypothetical protein